MSVIDDIAAERRRQIEVEGWTPEHDDEHGSGSMAQAAACYALRAARQNDAAHDLWPWDDAWWKPKDDERDLIRAAALLVAEIERRRRAAGIADQPSAVRQHSPNCRSWLHEKMPCNCGALAPMPAQPDACSHPIEFRRGQWPGAGEGIAPNLCIKCGAEVNDDGSTADPTPQPPILKEPAKLLKDIANSAPQPSAEDEGWQKCGKCGFEWRAPFKTACMVCAFSTADPTPAQPNAVTREAMAEARTLVAPRATDPTADGR